MQVIRLSNPHDAPRGMNRKLESIGGQTRFIEGIFDAGGEIGPHSHPTGEDCAVVLSGQLTYWINNERTVQVNPGEVVFGWKNVIHGYRNDSRQPLHLLVFATPGKIGLEYPSDLDPKVLHPPFEQRLLASSSERSVQSEFSKFTFVQVSNDYKEEAVSGKIVAFIDCEEKIAYVFDQQPVIFETLEEREKWMLRYEAWS